MMELCLMGSHAYPPGLKVVFGPEQGFKKDLHHFLHYHSSNQDLVNSHPFNLRLRKKEQWKSTGDLLDCNYFSKPTSRRPILIDVQDSHPELLHLGFGIAQECTRQEEILKLLASASLDVKGGLLDLSMLYDLIEPQQPLVDSPQHPFQLYSKWFCSDAKSQQSLIYPTTELYLNHALLDLVGDRSGLRENTHHPTVTEMTNIFLEFTDRCFSKNSMKSGKQTMLVPYFERRRRGRSNTDSSKLATEKVVPPKSHEKVKNKTSQKRKINPGTTKKRNISSNSYIHACESLLSMIVDRKQQRGNAFISLKKSGPQLTQLLTGCSASIAGTGIAVVLSIVCRAVCHQMTFCASKLLDTGLGLGLVCLSWAVNKLRDTVISMSRTSGKLGDKEEEMMDRLDQNLKDIYFRAAALMAIAVLRLA